MFILFYFTTNFLVAIFLRNIQVYFAKQKWPTDKIVSNNLKKYYLESLILFTNELLKTATNQANKDSSPIIRTLHLKNAVDLFLPSSTNTFEDVTFFPNHNATEITIESYDLDAFRDSGFHWRILSYSLNDLKSSTIHSLDPNAAELLVENIAQLGVLVLRLAGEFSKEQQKIVLDVNDVSQSFSKIQQLINSYQKKEIDSKTTISSSSQLNTNSIFEDVTLEKGIDFKHKSADWLSRFIRSYSKLNGKTNLTIPPAFSGSGVACEDINNDGYPDVLLLGGLGNKLLINTKSGSFKEINSTVLNSWNDKKSSYGEPRQPIIADFNNDGKQDVFITYVNQKHKMYKNIGNEKFEDITNQTHLGGENAVVGSATAFDFDNDGLLDIFIGYFGNYLDGILPTLSRNNQNGMANKLYRNLGDFKFEEVTFTSNLDSNSGWTQIVGHTDINQDGLQDIIVGNDFGKNKYYLNTKNGVFNEVSKSLKTDKPSFTMNIGIADLNRDLFPDFYISNIVVMQKDEKYVNPNATTEIKFDAKKMTTMRTLEANDLFLSNSNGKQLNDFVLSTNVGKGYSATGWSWDADFFDFDNDGDEDIYCLTGMNDFSVYASENPFYTGQNEKSSAVLFAQSNREKNVFFVNEKGALTNKAKELGVDLISNSRSASYFDFNLDGNLDIIINNYHDNAVLLKNNTKNNNNWIKIKLIGNPEFNINRDAIGSTIILNSKNNKNIWREIHSTTGYLSVHPKTQHIGLGTDIEAAIEIKWTNGEKYVLKNLKANIIYEIKYPNIIIEK